MKKLIPVLFLTSALSAKGFGEIEVTPDYDVWLTGPIVAPSGHCVPPGHVNYEPYFNYTVNRFVYDKHWNTHSIPHFTNVEVQPTFQIGVVNNVEFDISAPQFSYNYTVKKHDWVLNDIPWGLAFELLQDHPGKTWYPAIKLKLNASVPIGKYQHLNGKKLGTDAGGTGSWNPSAGIVMSRLFWITGRHYLAARLFNQYVIPTPVHVKGFNTYGGTAKTKGTVYPGHIFFSNIGLEYTVSQNWAFACDFVYQHNNKQRFSGRKGGAVLKAPSKESISIAPAVEYNWSANIGVIVGPWFTLAGRNATQFMTWVVAVNIYV